MPRSRLSHEDCKCVSIIGCKKDGLICLDSVCIEDEPIIVPSERVRLKIDCLAFLPQGSFNHGVSVASWLHRKLSCATEPTKPQRMGLVNECLLIIFEQKCNLVFQLCNEDQRSNQRWSHLKYILVQLDHQLSRM